MKRNKKQLYESIMKDVSKIVKKHLNEKIYLLYDIMVKTHDNTITLNNMTDYEITYDVIPDKLSPISYEINDNDLSYMFNECEELTEVIIENLNTTNVQDMSNMFIHCSSVQNITFNNFNTTNVQDMSNMFCDCNELKELDLTEFDTSNVSNMMSMFYNCWTLIELNLSNFDTSTVNNMSGMFYGCDDLLYLDLSNFDMTNVKKYSQMFYGCKSLKYIKCTQEFKDWCWKNSIKIALSKEQQKHIDWDLID